MGIHTSGLNRADRGSIVVITLWSILLLAAFAVILGSQTRQKLLFVQRLNERDKTHLVAEAAVKRAIYELTRPQEERSYDALQDPWSNNEAAFKDINVGDGKFNICYNYVDWKQQVVLQRFGLIDEERKININTADAQVLARLLQLVAGLDIEAAQGLAAAIVDWRGSGSQPSPGQHTTEHFYYHSYEAKYAPFEVLDELLLVKDMTGEVYKAVKEYLTIYGGGKVNINTASRPVLAALGLSDDLIEKIMALRSGKDEIEGTADDTVFETPSAIVPKLSQTYQLGAAEIAYLSNVVVSFLGTQSSCFMVTCEARLNNRKQMRSVAAVITRDGTILSWREL